MNPDKARELFSEYREGSLSPSLRAAFETVLKSDGELQSEYKQFDEILKDFEGQSAQTVEVPFDLHDKIIARLDKSIFEQRRNAKANWFSGWRLSFAGGLAAVAIIATLFSIKNNNSDRAISGSDFSQGDQQTTFSVSDGELAIKHGKGSGSVVVKNYESGMLIHKYDLESGAIDAKQVNSSANPVLLRVETDSGSKLEVVVIAIPGTEKATTTNGKSNALDFGKAVSAATGEPVRINVTDLSREFDWKIDPVEPTGQFGDPKSGGFQVTIERRQGMLTVND